MRPKLAAYALALAACGAAAPAGPPPEIAPDFEPLRERFDAAAGKVRAILLPAPT
jgi:hypothetical protein